MTKRNIKIFKTISAILMILILAFAGASPAAAYFDQGPVGVSVGSRSVTGEAMTPEALKEGAQNYLRYGGMSADMRRERLP